MKSTRREFFALAGLALPFGCASAPEAVRNRLPSHPPPVPKPAETPAHARFVGDVLKPPRLNEGDTVGLISPGGAIFHKSDIAGVDETLHALGLKTVLGRHALDRKGYLAGTDAERAADVNQMFADPQIDAVLALRGGWGCNRILPLLDYEMISENPKILMGYSDITSLLVALYAKSGLVSFHGPVGISTWNRFTVAYVRRILFEGEAVTMENPRHVGPPRVAMRDRIHTITPGTARGRLVGGNLSVLVSMIGSSYLPDWDGHILFLEDTREDIYRIDRMLTQLSLAGILSRLGGVIFGKCTRCDADDPSESLTLRQVFTHHLRPLGIPCWYGAMIGHITDKFTVPVGVQAEIDAVAGSITMLEPAVR